MRPTDLATAALVGAAALSHASWIVVDDRSPRDLGRFYESLPDLYAGQNLLALVRPGGWYNAALAVWLHVAGRSTDTFQAADVVALVGVLVGVALVARRLGGPAGGLIAVGIASGAPMIRGLARASWLHVPEAALLLGVLAVLTADPALRRRGAAPAVAALGALAVALRPSALPWLVPLVALAAHGAGRAGLRACLPWALAAIPAAVTLGPYLAAKLDARERYVSDVPALLPQLMADLGGPSLLAVGIGVLALGWATWQRGLPAGGPRLVLAAWAVIGLVLWGLFRAGLDNFTIAAAAVAVLAADAIAAAAPAVRAAGLGAALIAGLAPALAVLPPRIGPIAFLAGLPGPPGPFNLLRPWRGTPDPFVSALIAATCPGPCRIAVEDGLFEPNAEEPGRLGLFLLGRDDVTLVSLAEGPIDGPVDALVRWHTPPEETRRRSARYPRVPAMADALAARQGLAPAWSGAARQGRTRVWWTRGGALISPAPADPGDPSEAPPLPGPPR